MSDFVFQVSNHPEAGRRVPSFEAEQSWRPIWAGSVSTKAEARRAVEGLLLWYRSARVLVGGKFHYGVLR